MKLGLLIGAGNTANVYEWSEDKVLKLFHCGYSRDTIEREYMNSQKICNYSFPKPKAYELIQYEDRAGIIYEKVEGESLLEWVMNTGDIESCAKYMAELHDQIIQNKINEVPNYKDFLRYHIKNACRNNQKKEKEIIEILDGLEDGDSLCHGDFHPGNILIQNDKSTVIDFMNICHGCYLYDIARTVYLVEYTPVPEEMDDKELAINLKKSLADSYLNSMKIKREMIKDYLTVITVARASECPNE